jgi:flagellar protein FliT
MSSRLVLFEQMSTLSDRMVAAAIVNDWDTLVEYEHGMAAIRDQLQALDKKVGAGETAEPAMMPPATPQQAADAVQALTREQLLIQKILADAAEIRRHVEPWMAQVSELLGSQQRRRDVARAYAVSDGLDAA